MPLYLAYDNLALRDGFGAQVLRIMGIFALARKYKLRYLHREMIETIQEFSHGVSEQKELDDLLKNVNTFFSLPGFEEPTQNIKSIRVYNLGFKTLLKYIILYKYSPRNVVLNICLPFYSVERQPWIYEYAAEFIREKNKNFFSKRAPEKCVIHVRMGYGQQTEKPDYVRKRHLPLSYYVSILPEIHKHFNLCKSDTIIIHTDLAKNPIRWIPFDKKTIEELIVFGEEVVDNEVSVSGNDLAFFFERYSLCNLDFKHCDPFFDTFLEMCTSEILIMSNSAFSYVAGIINENIVIWPESHRHVRLPRWVSSKELDITLSEELLRG